MRRRPWAGRYSRGSARAVKSHYPNGWITLDNTLSARHIPSHCHHPDVPRQNLWQNTVCAKNETGFTFCKKTSANNFSHVHTRRTPTFWGLNPHFSRLNPFVNITAPSLHHITKRGKNRHPSGTSSAARCPTRHCWQHNIHVPALRFAVADGSISGRRHWRSGRSSRHMDAMYR